MTFLSLKGCFLNCIMVLAYFIYLSIYLLIYLFIYLFISLINDFEIHVLGTNLQFYTEVMPGLSWLV